MLSELFSRPTRLSTVALPPQWRRQKILSTIGFKAATHRCSTFMHAVAVTWQLAMLIIVKKARVRRLQTVKKVEEKDDAGRVTRRYLCMGMQKPVQVPEGTLKKMLLIVQAHDVKTCQQKLIAQGIITPESQFKLGEYRKLFEKFCLLLHLPQQSGRLFCSCPLFQWTGHCFHVYAASEILGCKKYSLLPLPRAAEVRSESEEDSLEPQKKPKRRWVSTTWVSAGILPACRLSASDVKIACLQLCAPMQCGVGEGSAWQAEVIVVLSHTRVLCDVLRVPRHASRGRWKS